MARPPAYRLHSEREATVHVGNNPEDLIELGKLLQSKVGRHYTVKDLYGKVIWEGRSDGQT